MKCANCENLKSKSVGHVSSVYWCGIVGDGYNGTSIGLRPWIGKPHPKCPIEHPELYAKGRNGRLFLKKEGEKK